MPSNESRRARNRRDIFVLVVFVIAVALFFTWLSSYSQHWSKLRVTFDMPGGKSTGEFFVSISSTDPERRKGLMFVKHLESDEGMLFVVPDEQRQSFWMKNCEIPLDIIFLSREFEVVSIHENAQPHEESPIPSFKAAMYALEVAAGRVKELGIERGAKLIAHGPVPKGLP